MREMKDSGIAWIGAMPRAWKMNTIAQIFLQVKCKNTGLQEKNLLSLSYGKVKRKSIDTVEGLLPESFDGYNIIEKDDIVLRLTDLQNDHTSLRVGLAEERGIITSAYLTIRNRSNFCPKYLYYYLHSFDIAKGFYGMGAGVRQGLNWDGVKWLKILAPSVPEQERIAAFLDAECAEIDAVLEKTRASIEEYKKLKQAVITQAVTKGIRGDRPMKNSGIEWIGDIPAEWKVNLIKNVATTGSGGTPESGNPSLYDGDINWICSYDLKERPITKSERRLTQLGADSIAGNVQLKGSVLVAMYGGSGTIGNSGILECEAKTNQAICSIKFNNGYITDYFGFYYILSIRKYWMIFAVGTRKDPNISQDIVRKMPCILPPIAEQEEIVAYCNKACDRLDTLITKKQQYLTEIENYKKSLIYEYVTGKKEVV